MTVANFAKESGFREICLPSPEREIAGVYIGDLLSWVMGKAEPDNAWITIMSNINIVAVSTLVDISCIILAEDVVPDEDALEVARSKGVNILSTSLSAYDTAIKLSEMLS